jgi:hypothetical protein
MKEIIIKLLKEVDIDMVKGWYRTSFHQTFPGYKIPTYLRNIPKKPRTEANVAKKRKRVLTCKSNKKRNTS